MADVTLVASGAEGFAVPIIESAACGVPSIVSDYSGCAEVGRACGAYMVEPGSYNPAQNTSVWIANPSIENIGRAVYRAYDESRTMGPDDRKPLVEAAKKYDWSVLAMSWLAILQSVVAKKKTVSYGAVI
jgi:glycosyltransferase involved in cell wall biosynthesis